MKLRKLNRKFGQCICIVLMLFFNFSLDVSTNREDLFSVSNFADLKCDRLLVACLQVFTSTVILELFSK